MTSTLDPIEDWSRTRELIRETAAALAAAGETLRKSQSQRAEAIAARLALCADRLVTPIRIVVAGEFNTGKTALCNRLIGVDALPTSALPTTNLWTKVYDAPAIEAFARLSTGQRLPIASTRPEISDWIGLEVGVPSARLAGIELIDLPGLADPRFSRSVSLVRDAHPHVMLWCSSSTQACKESERRQWLELPKSLRARSLLVLTFADLVKSPADRSKLERRANEMAAGVFAGVVMVTSKSALPRSGDPAPAAPYDVNVAWAAVCAQLSRLGQRRCQLASRIAHRMLSRGP